MIRAGDQHVDGGTFEPATITIKREIGNLLYLFPVQGLRCSQCDYEVISRDTAILLEHAEESLPIEVTEDPQRGLLTTLTMPNILGKSAYMVSESHETRDLEETSST